jgi:DNA modification methylase
MTSVVSITRTRKQSAEGLKRLPVLTAPLLRLNGLAPYYTMFPLSFPFDALANSEPGQWVLDPFCGRGTTILAARLRGLSSVGVDSNPVAGAIASSKLAQVRPSEIIRLAKDILANPKPGPVQATPQGEFWDLCYASSTLRDICRIRNHLLTSCTTRVEVALRCVMLGILHGPLMKVTPTYLSNQMPRTYSTKPSPAVRYWRKKGLTPPPEIDVLAAVSRRARFSFEEVPASTPGKVITGDSRTFNFERLGAKFSWVITSPPYYGMRTYFPDHWLRNWFVGGPTDIDYRADDQLSHHGEDMFVADLATVWKKTAAVCVPGAKLICRFGALPSCKKDPRLLFRRSLAEAGCGWRITTIREAGNSQHGRRQCDQFGGGKNPPLEEIDVYAVLE